MAATSPWSGADEGAMRLIAPGGPPAADGSLAAAIEIRLAPGWKTYWRNPGAAGLPPVLDFSRSVNLGAIEIAFPAPGRFDDGGSVSAGYAAPVVLPMRVRPAVAGAPVILDLAAQYGICRELCVPAQAEARLAVSAATAADPAAAAAIAASPVPRPAAPGETPAVVSIAPAEEPGSVVVTARIGPATAFDLFAEGPGDAFPGLPQVVGRDGDTATWRIRLDRYRTAPAGTPLRLTLVVDGVAVEQSLALP